jgi:Transposase DDE domain
MVSDPPLIPSSLPPSQAPAPKLDLAFFRSFTDTLFGEDLHAKRVESIANATAGVVQAASAAIHAIGAGYAAVACKNSKHGIKQVTRLLSNEGFDVAAMERAYVEHVLGQRSEAVLSLDWTDYDSDNQTTLVLTLVTAHGRSTPLLWKTIEKSELAGQQKELEHAMIKRFHSLVPDTVKLTLLADRGFGDQNLYALLDALGWDYVIRFRGNILVEDAAGNRRKASAWVQGSRPKKLVSAKVTADQAEVAAVVVVHDQGMKEPWCLVTSLATLAASKIIGLYAKRFRMEETFRDDKDIHFGFGLSATHIHEPLRRDRLLFLLALARVLLTLLGAASEQTGLDRTLKASTTKKRTHSLLRQGLYWYGALPHMKAERTELLMGAFGRLVASTPLTREVFGLL